MLPDSPVQAAAVAISPHPCVAIDLSVVTCANDTLCYVKSSHEVRLICSVITTSPLPTCGPSHALQTAQSWCACGSQMWHR